jgi:hypothetical protein
MTNEELRNALRADGWDVLAVDDSLCSTPHKVIRFSGKALCAFASHDSRWKSYHAAVVKATDPDDIVQQLMLDDNERKFRTPPFRTLLPLTNDELRLALRADGWDVVAVDPSTNYSNKVFLVFSNEAILRFAEEDARWYNHRGCHVEKGSNLDDAIKQMTLIVYRSSPVRTLPAKPVETEVEELGRKDDEEKAAPQLIPPFAEEEVARVLAAGAKKYSPENWRLVPGAGGPRGRYIGAALRHINAYRQGDQEDRETGLHPLAHAVASLLFVMELEL